MLRKTFLSICVTVALFAASPHEPLVTGVDSIGLTVSDLDRSVAFYSKVLSFEKVSERESAGLDHERLNGVRGMRARTARMRLGDEFLELTEYRTPKGRPMPAGMRSNDRWFQHVAIIVTDMDRAYEMLRTHNVVHVSPAPQLLPAWNPNASGIRAFYFYDPDGHPLEILSFPPDKGAAKWHPVTDKLFLGIDHTAIVISDTETSLRFYRDVLGLQVVGRSENYGPEQEKLNNVSGARLKITALRAASGPGIEFLQYLAPGDGRPYPPEERANDLIHWQTMFSGTDAALAARRFRKFRSAFVSTGVVESRSPKAKFRKALIVRDPDGHAVQIAGE